MIVTVAQAGQTIELTVGQRLVLQLGTGYDWTTQVGGSGVLVPVAAPLPAGVQGEWVAERIGTASILAIGNPPCLQAKPPCGMPSRAFDMTVVVR